ncbi:MAG TPA: hypothetical protein VK841_22675 [Polyangiaceae bacterium]|nr:hypothetical protein [Polyangiaceae bacterium]
MAKQPQWYARLWKWLNEPSRKWTEQAHAHQKSGYEIIGELLRETAVLILVFGVLDPLIGERGRPPYPWPAWSWLIGGSTAVALGLGGWFEVSTKRRMNPALFAMMAFGGFAALGVASHLIGRIQAGTVDQKPGPNQEATAADPASFAKTAVSVQMVEAPQVAPVVSVLSTSPVASTVVTVAVPTPSASQPLISGSAAPVIAVPPPESTSPAR